MMSDPEIINEHDEYLLERIDSLERELQAAKSRNNWFDLIRPLQRFRPRAPVVIIAVVCALVLCISWCFGFGGWPTDRFYIDRYFGSPDFPWAVYQEYDWGPDITLYKCYDLKECLKSREINESYWRTIVRNNSY